MFQQLLTPVGDSLGLSFLVAILPVLAVLVLLGLLRRPAWQAALSGLVVGLVVAIFVWRMPPSLALAAVLVVAATWLADHVDAPIRRWLARVTAPPGARTAPALAPAE